MEAKFVPTFDIYDIERSLMNKYGDDFYDLAWILFDDDEINENVYLYFQYNEDEEIREFDKNRAEKRNIVRDYMRELFPMYDYVLFHVYW